VSVQLERSLVDGGKGHEEGVEARCGARQLNDQAVVMLPIGSLYDADSPRLGGENDEHSRTLAESDANLPPIIVHRSTMRVIDGMHRLRAARLRGEKEIAAVFFDGTADDAFVLAVEANIGHGLPLSLADRKAAALRIVKTYQHWSDRAIGRVTGLAHKTIAAIRRASGDVAQLHTRVGRDGRVRPVDASEGRRLASEFLASNPGASLREIAKAAGVSLGTARDVRNRLQRGEDPQRRRAVSADRLSEGRGGKSLREQDTMIRQLRSDPSLRFTESGRVLLRLIDVHAMAEQDWNRLVDAVPAHLRSTVTNLARVCIGGWQDFVEQLDSRDADR